MHKKMVISCFMLVLFFAAPVCGVALDKAQMDQVVHAYNDHNLQLGSDLN